VLRSSGREILIVSSGAIVSGIRKLGLKEYLKASCETGCRGGRPEPAHVGIRKIVERVDVKVAQILLTHQDLADRRRFLNARHTLAALIGSA